MELTDSALKRGLLISISHSGEFVVECRDLEDEAIYKGYLPKPGLTEQGAYIPNYMASGLTKYTNVFFTVNEERRVTKLLPFDSFIDKKILEAQKLKAMRNKKKAP